MENKNEYIEPYKNQNKNRIVKIEHLSRYIFARDIIQKRFSDQTRLLDLGCGAGYGTEILSKAVDETVGLDKNNEALQKCKSLYSSDDIYFIKHDLEKSLENLELEQTDTIDIIVAFEVLEHLNNPDKTVKSVQKILFDDGLFIGSVPNSKFESLDENGKPKNPYHKTPFTLEEIEKLLRDNNFHQLDFYGQPYTNINMLKEKNPDFLKRVTSDSKFTNEEKLKIAEKYSYPTRNRIENSYSMIFLAKKN